MTSWEEIANEVVPSAPAQPALATGAARGRSGKRGNLGQALSVSRYLSCPEVALGAHHDVAWGGRLSDCGGFYQVERDLLSYDDQAHNLVERLHRALEKPPSSWLAGLCPDDLLFFDIETTGLSASAPLFLIGTLTFHNRQPNLCLHLARSFEEERAVLAAFARLTASRTLVSFNGKSFDWPYVEGRSSRWRVPLPPPEGHFDLLFSARTRWRSQLPNCRLQTLEMGICGRGREGDIPSSQIPDRYHQWLSGSRREEPCAHLLAPVLFHNALDVLTMAELVCCLSEQKLEG